MSDIYVKGWMTGLEDDIQKTDVHYRFVISIYSSLIFIENLQINGWRRKFQLAFCL